VFLKTLVLKRNAAKVILADLCIILAGVNSYYL
jgi:hypothetical protein